MGKAVLFFMLNLAGLAACWAWLGRPQAIPKPVIAQERRLECVSYAPFQGAESPFFFDKGFKVPPQRLEADMALLSKRFSCVRIYSPRGLERLPELAQQYGLELLLGAWVSANPHDTRREINQVIRIARKYPRLIRAVIIGNEALLRKEVTGAQLANYLRQARDALPGVPVTYADVWEFWLQHPEVAPHTDFITIHILPYWENDPVPIGEAMEHAERIYAKVARTFPDKRIFIGETGWPSYGRMREGALPSPVNQARYIRGFVDLAASKGWQYNLIEAFDQPWKRVNEGAVGGNWGLYDTRRNDKGVFSGTVSNYPDWRRWLGISIGIQLAYFLLIGFFSRFKRLRWCQWLALAPFALAAGIVIPLHVRESLLIARFPVEYGWAAFATLLSLACSLLWLRFWSKTDSSRLSQPYFNLLHVISAGSMLLALLGFIFDFRYRSFPTYGFFLPAALAGILAELTPRDRRTTSGWFLEKKLLGLLLLAGGAFVLWNETPFNWQANGWVVICALMAYSLLNRGESPSSTLNLSAHRRFWFISALLVLVAGVGASLIRYGLMESPEVAAQCAGLNGPFWCGIRDQIGLLIHFRYFAWIGLTVAAASYFLKGSSLGPIALAFSVVGLTLYNTDVASYGFLLSLMRTARAKL